MNIKLLIPLLFFVFLGCGNPNSTEEASSNEQKEFSNQQDSNQLVTAKRTTKTDDISGVYFYESGGAAGRIMIYETKKSTYLGYLTFNTGAPSMNIGTLLGCIKKNNDTWIIQGIESQENCKFKLSFRGDTLMLSNLDNLNHCDFGVNVNPEGNYTKSLKKEDQSLMQSIFEEGEKCKITILGDNDDIAMDYCSCGGDLENEGDFTRMKMIRQRFIHFFEQEKYDFSSEHYDLNWKDYWLRSIESIIDLIENNKEEEVFMSTHSIVDFTGDGNEDTLKYFIGIDEGEFIRGLRLKYGNHESKKIDLSYDIATESQEIMQSDFLFEMNQITKNESLFREIESLVDELKSWMYLLQYRDLEKSHPVLTSNSDLQDILAKNKDTKTSSDNTVKYIRNYKGFLVGIDEWGFDGSFYIIWHNPSSQWLKFSVSGFDNELGDFEFL